MKGIITFELRKGDNLEVSLYPFVAKVTVGSDAGVGYGRTCEEAEQIAIRNLRIVLQKLALPVEKEIEIDL